MTKKRKRAAANGDGSVYYLKSRQRWMVGYVDIDGKRKTYVAEKQTEAGAQAHLRRLLRDRDSGETLRVAKAHTLASWFEEWLEAKALADAKPRTIEAYRERITKHILPRLGSRPLAKIGPDDIQAAYNAILRSKSATTGKPLSRTTASLIHDALHTVLLAARRRRLVGFVATELVEPPRRTRYEARTLTIDESRRLLAATREHRHGPLWTFMLGTGCRFGEAAGLTWAAVDLDAATARIYQQVTRERRDGKVRHVIATVKTAAGKRTVPLPSFVVAALHDQRKSNDERRALARAKKHKWSDEHPDLVFPSVGGGLLSENYVLVAWHKLLRDPSVALEGQPGQAPLRMHDLRHTKGTLMSDAGEDTTTIQRTLGHARQSITADIYIGNTANELQRAAARFDELLSPSQDDKEQE